jgi:hypothetical protein
MSWEYYGRWYKFLSSQIWAYETLDLFIYLVSYFVLVYISDPTHYSNDETI